ncbi:hypothetical protein [Arthrobacter sp. 754]|uniref:hypothetical protein n=1 Tax=Arthrobacter sp. 754 TaxID=3156315 RepID=UPI003394F1F9
MDARRQWHDRADPSPAQGGCFKFLNDSTLAEPAAQKAADDLLLLRTRVPGKLGAVISRLVVRMAQHLALTMIRCRGPATPA